MFLLSVFIPVVIVRQGWLAYSQSLNLTGLYELGVLDTNVTKPFNFTSFPEPCTDQCNNIVSVINTCEAFSCLCTIPRETNFTACVDCLVAKQPTEDVIIQGQEAVIQFASTCNANNISILTQTVSGFTGFPTESSTTETTAAPTATTLQTSPSPTTPSAARADIRVGFGYGGIILVCAFMVLF